MVWTRIMQDICTSLHVFDNGSLKAQRYRQEDLERDVHLFSGAVGPEFIFIDGSARAHKDFMVND